MKIINKKLNTKLEKAYIRKKIVGLKVDIVVKDYLGGKKFKSQIDVLV